MKKLLNEPIEIKSYNDLKEIVGFHPCQKISFICENCGEKTIKSLSAVRKRKLLCQKCQRTLNGIKKYGSEENFKQHLKDVKKKIDETLEKKFGSTEEIKKHKVESYKKTCIEKCGVDNTSKVDFIKNNFKTNNPIFNPESKEKARLNYTKEKHTEAAKKTVKYLKDNNLYPLLQEKIRKTKLEKYGDSGYTNTQQTFETIQTKYNCKCGFNIAVNKKISNIESDGYVRISKLSNDFDYYEEGICFLLNELNIPIKKYGTWRCVKKEDVPSNLDEIIKKHINTYRSIGEREMFDYIHTISNDAINNDRQLISPKEINIFVPSKNVGFEFDGLFWHSEENLLNKTLLCLEKGVKLLHFYEDEWLFKQDICKSIISSALGIYQNKVYARKCEIREISNNEYRDFLNENHIQGSVNSKIKIGLFYNNELIQCIGVGKTRYSDNQFELYRMCSKKFHQVIGGFSKLLKYLKQKYNITEL